MRAIDYGSLISVSEAKEKRDYEKGVDSFIAPETRIYGKISQQSDVYSLGLVFGFY